MIKNNIRTLIFDLGGVLIRLDVQQTVEAFKTLGIIMPEEEQKRTDFFALMHDFEKGLIGAGEFRTGLRRYSRNHFSDEALDKAWHRMLAEYSRDTLDFINTVKNNYTVCLLSNTNEIHVPYFTMKMKDQTGYDIHHLFHKVYYSHVLHMRKPEPEIFRHVMDDNRTTERETLLIDDNEENIDAAREMGMHAHLYTFGERMADVVRNYAGL